jgi:hypothetical protein
MSRLPLNQTLPLRRLAEVVLAVTMLVPALTTIHREALGGPLSSPPTRLVKLSPPSGVLTPTAITVACSLTASAKDQDLVNKFLMPGYLSITGKKQDAQDRFEAGISVAPTFSGQTCG